MTWSCYKAIEDAEKTRAARGAAYARAMDEWMSPTGEFSLEAGLEERAAHC